MLNPWLILIALAVAAGAYFQGRRDGRSAELAEAARDEQVAKIAADAANASIAEGLSKLKVQNRTIYNETQREVQTHEVYRDPDCRVTDGGLRNINEALTGAKAPAGDSKLPATNPAAGPDARGPDAQASGGGNDLPRVPPISRTD